AANTGSCTEITDTTTITSSGCYVVTSDLVGSTDGAYITVEADDVTIKGQGNTLEAGSLLTQTVTSSDDPFVESNRVAVYVDGGSGTVSNVTVRNLTTADYSVAVYADDTSGLTVSNVHAKGLGSGGVGIRLNESTGATIRDTTLNGGPLQLFDGTDGTLVENVTVRDSVDRGIYVRNADRTTISETTVRNVTLSGSTTGHGVVLEETVGTTLYRVVVNETDNRGVFLSGARGTTIQSTTVEGVSKDGITVFDGRNVTVAGARVFAGGDGIVVFNSSNFTLTTSRIVSRVSGLYLGESPGTLVRNTTVQSETTGISIRSGTSDTLVTDSLVVGDGNRVEGPGIGVSSTYLPTNNVTISDTSVLSLGPTGIYVSNATDATITGNTLVNVTAGPNAPDSTGNGIELVSGATGATVRDNDIVDVSGTGVVVGANDTLVADTLVAETGDSGVATDAADGVTFRNLTLVQTNDTAISLESSGNVTVEASTVVWPQKTTETTAPDGFVFVNDTDGNLSAIAADGNVTDYGVTDAETIGPRAFLDEDELRDVPYVDGRGNLEIVDETGDVKTLVASGTLGTDPRTGKSKLAVGDWDHDGATDVFFANGNGDLFRVDWNERNDPE
ncbi:MAG: right-handed parallel beta-helix repeat-containing protein, partial [Halobaculum sp.]